MKHFSVSVQTLAATPPKDWPIDFSTKDHLIFSSPATLAFNAPGAEGFGVKRAALSLPNSRMLLFSPGCCGRNTAALGGAASEKSQRMHYLLLDETDIVTGRYVPRIVEACTLLAKRFSPEVLLLCSTCVDALLGTDMDRLCATVSRETSIPTLSATMYALTREGHEPPMVAIRKTLYSLLRKRPKNPHAALLLGSFTHLQERCELYPLLASIGIDTVYELGRLSSMEAYYRMAEANFSLILHPESRLAAKDLAERLGIASIELTQSYEVEKIHHQYQALGKVLGVPLDDSAWYTQSKEKVQACAHKLAGMRIAIGESGNSEPLGLAVALARMGATVVEIFANPDPSNHPLLDILANISPETRIASNTSPSMLFYTATPVDCAIGVDACFYHPEAHHVPDASPLPGFGYQGLNDLLDQILEEKPCGDS
ncbi:MAG: hypothetical protein IJS54_06345 [Desulfovibrio sp.]|nr:hypothetical protein [Desulfovibrio sp.]